MFQTVVFVTSAFFIMTSSVLTFEIVSRSEWDAKPAKEITYINRTVSYVIIHHSYMPAACDTHEKCVKAMQSMQKFHQVDRGWWDIGYSFGVGGDGKVYEGRGFNVIAAHAPKYNDKSIGICLIGDWRTARPPDNMLQATRDLIDYAIDFGYLWNNYTLYGHRQVRSTECPGDALFNEIKTWPHFQAEVRPL